MNTPERGEELDGLLSYRQAMAKVMRPDFHWLALAGPQSSGKANIDHQAALRGWVVVAYDTGMTGATMRQYVWPRNTTPEMYATKIAALRARRATMTTIRVGE